jgi:hypothetical protein
VDVQKTEKVWEGRGVRITKNSCDDFLTIPYYDESFRTGLHFIVDTVALVSIVPSPNVLKGTVSLDF